MLKFLKRHFNEKGQNWNCWIHTCTPSKRRTKELSFDLDMNYAGVTEHSSCCIRSVRYEVEKKVENERTCVRNYVTSIFPNSSPLLSLYPCLPSPSPSTSLAPSLVINILSFDVLRYSGNVIIVPHLSWRHRTNGCQKEGRFTFTSSSSASLSAAFVSSALLCPSIPGNL